MGPNIRHASLDAPEVRFGSRTKYQLLYARAA
jgi:hypothetical protein